jgi:predicted short-subunit dehydrogenase-like oxidoreductase (DUF2520 family)
MTFSIIGTGNIAWFFGSRFVAAQHHCTGVFGRDKAETKKLAERLLADKYGAIESIEDGLCDICFLAISDSSLGDTAACLAFKKTVLVHTAGAVSLDVIKAGAQDTALLWPVYSILKGSLPTHKDIPCAWEASTNKAKTYVLEMAAAITDNAFEAMYEQRKWLHLSAVIGNNFVNHLLAICEQICTDNQLPYSVLKPIIEQTFERTRQASPGKLQTGPAVRNDIPTITAQLALLAHHPEWQQMYAAITASIQSQAGNEPLIKNNY